MEKEALQELLGTDRPCTIISSSGECYKVPHPDFVSVAPGTSTVVIVYRSTGQGFSILDLTTIADVQVSHSDAA